MSEAEIKSILKGLPSVKVDQVGSLWSISIGGSLSGARKDGKALAIDLRKQWEHIRDRERAADNVYFAKPEPVEIPAFLQDNSEMEAIKAELAALKAERDEVPEGLKEFVREGEPHGEAQTRLWKLYTELTGKMMLKLATSEETRTHTRLHGALYWVSRGAVDVI